MNTFTTEELKVLRLGLDLMVRDEGKALAQVGVEGLLVGALTERFSCIFSANQKIDKKLKDQPPMDDATINKILSGPWPDVDEDSLDQNLKTAGD